MRSAKISGAKAGALLLSGIALALLVPPASAADWGVGVAHFGQGNTVLIPIRMESLIVEPEIYYSRSKQDFTSIPSGINGNGTISQYGLATGIYGRSELGPSFESYVGARAGVSKGKFDQTSGISTFNQKYHSWFVAPTAGLQYYFAKQFSIALDVGLVYADSKEKFTLGVDEQTTDSKDLSTLTRILLRGYF